MRLQTQTPHDVLSFIYYSAQCQIHCIKSVVCIGRKTGQRNLICPSILYKILTSTSHNATWWSQTVHGHMYRNLRALSPVGDLRSNVYLLLVG